MSDLVVDACPLLHALSGIGRYTHEVSRRLGGLGGEGMRLRYHYGPVADSAPAPGRRNLPWIMRCRVPFAAHLWVHLAHRLERNGRRGWDTYWEPNNACPFDVAPRRLVLTLRRLDGHLVQRDEADLQHRRESLCRGPDPRLSPGAAARRSLGGGVRCWKKRGTCS